ncbi:(2Fe-2S)-binding protein [Salininema proteolyticum]|uniref:(2Fe-2S)-binding protein n=1 Tax=Salininema proteolyticum TaxID=1607685 RepID=A0ABV8TXI7_9ACTN
MIAFPPDIGARVLAPSPDESWYFLGDMLEGLLVRHFDAFAETLGCSFDASTGYNICVLAGLYARPAVWAWREHGVLPAYGDSIAFRFNGQNRYDAVSFTDFDPIPPSDGGRALAGAVHSFGADLVAALAPHTRIGARGLWAHVTDVFANAFLPRPPLGTAAMEASREAERVLALAEFPTPGPRWTRFDGAVTGLWTSCCLWYKVPGEEVCAPVCPRITDAELPGHLAEWRRRHPDRR